MDTLESLFSHVDADSGLLSGLSAVVHTFDEVGSFHLGILEHNEQVATSLLEVQHAEPPAGESDAAPVARGHHADLASLRRPRVGAQKRMTVDRGAPVLFDAASGEAPHAVVVRRAATAPAGLVGQPLGAGAADQVELAPGPAAFDSRALGPGDIFSTVLLRPGTYALANTLGAGAGIITVDYPVITPGVPYRPPGPVTIECNDDGFAPAQVGLKPCQGVVVHINTRARITVTLTAADDGPTRAATTAS